MNFAIVYNKFCASGDLIVFIKKEFPYKSFDSTLNKMIIL